MIRRLVVGLVFTSLAAAAASAGRTVAVGDIHGEIDGFDSVLRAAALIDDEERWVGGDAVLVQTGDMTDRGPRVRAVMDRMRSLEQQAPTQGGRVVALLGNHEISNLTHLFDTASTPARIYREIWSDFAGDNSGRRQRTAYQQWLRWRQQYPGCVKQENQGWIADRTAWFEDHPPGFVEYIEAISATGEYGRWLRGLPIAAEVGGTVFLHGGLSPELVERGYRSVAAINEAAAAALSQLDEDRQRLIQEQVILPFSTLWEMHCAVYVEMARLEKKGRAKAMARHAELAELNARLPGMAGWFPTEGFGPLWYRGLATAEEADLAPGLETVLEAFGVERIAVGHTPQPGQIRSRFGGRVYLIDTAMAYPEMGGRAAALEIGDGRVTAIYADERVLMVAEPSAASGGDPLAEPVEGTNGHGDKAVESTNGHDDEAVESTHGHREPANVAPVADSDPAPAPPAKETWLGPDGNPLPFANVDEVLEFLAKAKLVDESGLDTGVTLPRKLLLERDGVRAHAIFHNVQIEKRRERLRGGRVVNFFRDHYANNVAAFELSRMLGMTNVPPAVIRRIGRGKGSVSLWIEGSRTETDRRREQITPEGDWRLTNKDMLVFDNLANNIDRNQGNILYDADWNLWFIDHTRTFGRIKQLPSPARIRRCSRRLYQALRALDEAEVKRRLKPYLGIYEIEGMMARRDLLLELIEDRIATTSEMAVLFDYGDPTTPTDEGDPEIPEAPAEPPSF